MTRRRRSLPASSATQAGFTLIELMITVAVVGILTALAYPSYVNYLIRGYLVDGPNGLNAVRAQMEQYFQDNRSYQTVGSFNPPCLTAQTFNKFTVQCTQADLAPTVNANGVTVPGFKLTATGNAGTQVAGFVYTLDNFNNQATPSAKPGWPTSNSCWLTSKTASCP